MPKTDDEMITLRLKARDGYPHISVEEWQRMSIGSDLIIKKCKSFDGYEIHALTGKSLYLDSLRVNRWVRNRFEEMMPSIER